jgi:hypothetical protein
MNSARLLPEHVLGAVAVMDIEIDHGHTVQPPGFQRMACGDGDAGKQAEPHGAVAFGVVAGRARGDKGVLCPAIQHRVHRRNASADACQRRAQRSGARHGCRGRARADRCRESRPGSRRYAIADGQDAGPRRRLSGPPSGAGRKRRAPTRRRSPPRRGPPVRGGLAAWHGRSRGHWPPEASSSGVRLSVGGQHVARAAHRLQVTRLFRVDLDLARRRVICTSTARSCTVSPSRALVAVQHADQLRRG